MTVPQVRLASMDFTHIEYLSDKERKNNKFFILDETVTGFSVKYGEDSFNIETNGECFEAVNELFFQLAEKYADNNK